MSANVTEKIYHCESGSDLTAEDMADLILNDPELPQLRSIIIGMWYDNCLGGENINPILEMMVNNKERFQQLEALFVGDIGYEDNEISWIEQGNYEQLLKALPHLKSLTIKGSIGLSFGKIDHDALEALEIICGGLPKEVVEGLKTARLPNLKKLVLYCGVEDYGYDCKLTDFAAIAKKSLFPNLVHLGFNDSSEQDELVRIMLESDLLPQLEVMEISCGCLTDRGGQMILDAVPRMGAIKKIMAGYHYLSEAMMEKWQQLPFTVDVSDAQGTDDDDDMYPMITE